LCNSTQLLYNCHPKKYISAGTGGERKNACTLFLSTYQQTSSALPSGPAQFYYYYYSSVSSHSVSSDTFTFSLTGSLQLCGFSGQREKGLSGTPVGGRNVNIVVTEKVIEILATVLMERFNNCTVQYVLHVAGSGFKCLCYRDKPLASGQRCSVSTSLVHYLWTAQTLLSWAGAAEGRTWSAM